MMKNTLIMKKEKMEWNHLLLLLSGILVGMVHGEIGLIIMLLYLEYMIKQGVNLYFIAAMVMNVVMLSTRNEYFLFVFVASIATFIFVKLYEKLHVEAFSHIGYFHSAMIGIGLYFMHYSIKHIGILMLCVLILSWFMMKNNKEEDMQHVVFFFMGSLFLLAVSWNESYYVWFALALMVVFAYTLSFELCFVVSLYFMLQEILYLYLFILLFINYAKGKRALYSCFAFITLVFDFGLMSVCFSIACLIAGLFSYGEDDAFMVSASSMEKSHQLYMQHSFYRQLMDYSSIFFDLSSYYQDVSLENAAMLKIMGEAMERNAKVSKQYFYYKEEMGARIVSMLKGYKFTVLSCTYENEDDKTKIMLELSGLYEYELEEVILPLLEKITQTRLHVSHRSNHMFQKDRIKLFLESDTYHLITTFSDSIYVKEVNGDSYHSVMMNDSVVCMMSDGMGQGSKAKKISSTLIHMLETMMRCEIPQMECVKLLNQFMRSDIYATLDILSLDRKRNVAYLSKSASAPTYLYRNGMLHEMSAHSLPIGIVENIQADVYEIPFYKGDIFLMVSDGIERFEIERWTSLKRCSLIKNEGINMMNILKEKTRKDDSSFLMVMIS